MQERIDGKRARLKNLHVRRYQSFYKNSDELLMRVNWATFGFLLLFCGAGSVYSDEHCDIRNAIKALRKSLPPLSPPKEMEPLTAENLNLAWKVFGTNGQVPQYLIRSLSKYSAKEQTQILFGFDTADLSPEENRKLVAGFGMTLDAGSRAHQLARITDAEHRKYVLSRMVQEQFLLERGIHHPEDYDGINEYFERLLDEKPIVPDEFEYNRANETAHLAEPLWKDPRLFDREIQANIGKIQGTDKAAIEKILAEIKESWRAARFAQLKFAKELNESDGIRLLREGQQVYRRMFLDALKAQANGNKNLILDGIVKLGAQNAEYLGARRAPGYNSEMIAETVLCLRDAHERSLASEAAPLLIKSAKEDPDGHRVPELLRAFVNAAARYRAEVETGQGNPTTLRQSIKNALQALSRGDSDEHIFQLLEKP